MQRDPPQPVYIEPPYAHLVSNRLSAKQCGNDTCQAIALEMECIKRLKPVCQGVGG